METTEEPQIFCKKCNQKLPVSSFYISSKTNKTVFPCKSCKRNYYKSWTTNNPDYHKNWKSRNKDRVKEHNKKYRDKQKESLGT